VHEPWEVRDWTKHFGCSKEQLKEAVSAAGVMVGDTEAYLKRKGSTAR